MQLSTSSNKATYSNNATYFNNRVEQLSNEYLADRCATETQRFFKQQVCDTQYGHELFRRALLTQDERAWAIVYQQYQPLVASWLKQRLPGQVAEVEFQTLMDDAFVKMAGTFARHPEKFNNYPNLNALLGLLRRCSERVAQDFITKAIQEPAALPLQEDMIIISDAYTNSDTLWARLAALLYNEQEGLVVRYLLIEGHKPRHLFEDYLHLFQNVDEINTIRERIKLRLRRNLEFHHFLCSLSEQ